MKQTISLISLIVIYFLLTGSSCVNNIDAANESARGRGLIISDSILNNILTLYDVPEHGLLQETYPVNPNHKVSYLAEGSKQSQLQEVSFLWPYSGVLSGVVSLYKNTHDEKYLSLLEERILPGLETYYDSERLPAGYQSYPVFAGPSDRFYDDNVWLALDFCELYSASNDQKYLDKAIEIYEFVFSGWDDILDGGIYWCEQNKSSKNTCSNAPGTVMCAKLYQLTKDEKYLEAAKKTYKWTKDNLLDPSDNVYWDNVAVTGKIGKAKYTYNSGQMIESGVLLYKLTNDKEYLEDAQKTAAGTYNHFTSMKETEHGEKRFYSDSPWFNVILLRGLNALYQVDGNKEYLDTMKDNALYAWEYVKDENNLLSNSWSKASDVKHKWLLDNACLIELFSELNESM